SGRQAPAGEVHLPGRAEDERQGRPDRYGGARPHQWPGWLRGDNDGWIRAGSEQGRADLMSAAMATTQTNPFPGLRPFREDEEHLFFGRENQVDTMVDKLAGTHFLAVIGTSGSGKSSLVNCGLRPALRQGLMARAGTAWRMAQFRPGEDPIGAMARALAQE